MRKYFYKKKRPSKKRKSIIDLKNLNYVIVKPILICKKPGFNKRDFDFHIDFQEFHDDNGDFYKDFYNNYYNPNEGMDDDFDYEDEDYDDDYEDEYYFEDYEDEYDDEDYEDDDDQDFDVYEF